ncbi:MAG: globin [Actinobacteria bacterium]|nr:globin [Actinomycetota bacterium]NBY15169.1 globin [Actinomycetota bacterium]
MNDSFYEAIGGHDFFESLVSGFYEGIESDPVLRPMYPDGDLTQAKQHLTLFLEQYWGGPRTYQAQRGHPRLRMRHAEFVINDEARDRWIAHMKASLECQNIPDDLREELWAYLENAAHSLVNAISH